MNKKTLGSTVMQDALAHIKLNIEDNIADVPEHVAKRCKVCEMTSGEIKEFPEFGLAHSACYAAVIMAKESQNERHEEKMEEIEQRRRFKELQQELTLAVDVAKADAVLWIEPEVHYSSKKVSKCAVCGEIIKKGETGLTKGYDPMVAHTGCLVDSILQSPDFQAWLFWERKGLVVKGQYQTTLIRAMAQAQVSLERQFMNTVVQPPKPRKIELKFEETPIPFPKPEAKPEVKKFHHASESIPIAAMNENELSREADEQRRLIAEAMDLEMEDCEPEASTTPLQATKRSFAGIKLNINL